MLASHSTVATHVSIRSAKSRAIYLHNAEESFLTADPLAGVQVFVRQNDSRNFPHIEWFVSVEGDGELADDLRRWIRAALPRGWMLLC